MTDFAVELKGVSKKFGSHQAVYPMDLQIPKGKIFGFIGPNGSGKTTTMRMILRIYKPDTGVVHVLGASDGDCGTIALGICLRSEGSIDE